MNNDYLHHFSDMKAFKHYTSQAFLNQFQTYVDITSSRTVPNLLDNDDKMFIMEVAQSTLSARGVGIQAWLLLQSYVQGISTLQSFNTTSIDLPSNQATVPRVSHDTEDLRSSLTLVAVAYYAQFASYEIRDDLPCFDNDEVRRGQQTIWKKYGEQKAVLFADIMSTFAVYTINISNLTKDVKYRLSLELIKANNEVAIGHLMEGRPQGKCGIIQRTLCIHEMKVGSFGSAIAAGGAIIANADENVISKMTLFGSAVAHAAQIDNDCEYGAMECDLKQGSVNILNAVNIYLDQEYKSDTAIFPGYHIILFSVFSFAVSRAVFIKSFGGVIIIFAILVLVCMLAVPINKSFRIAHALLNGFNKPVKTMVFMDEKIGTMNKELQAKKNTFALFFENVKQLISGFLVAPNFSVTAESATKPSVIDRVIINPLQFMNDLIVVIPGFSQMVSTPSSVCNSDGIFKDRVLFYGLNIFDGYINEAKGVVDSFESPNTELFKLLEVMEQAFNLKISAQKIDKYSGGTLRSEKEVNESESKGRSTIGY